VEDFALPKQSGKSLYRLLPKRYYILLAMGLICALSAIRLCLTSSKDFDAWTQFLQEDAARITREIKMLPTPESFTIVLKGSRLDMIQQSLDAHSRCPSVEDVVIDFDGMEHIPESLLSHRTGKVGHILEGLSTQGLFLLEEGIVLSCDEIEKAFIEWKRDPRRMVGFFGYRAFDNTGRPNKSYGALGTELVPPGSGSYSLLSDRAMFIHPRYFEAVPIVAEAACCHLLLSMQVSAVSSQTPLVMRSTPRELLDPSSSPALSSLRGRDGGTEGCSTNCVPRWLLPTESTPFREEGKSILG